jgi:hypothetical protein
MLLRTHGVVILLAAELGNTLLPLQLLRLGGTGEFSTLLAHLRGTHLPLRTTGGLGMLLLGRANHVLAAASTLNLGGLTAAMTTAVAVGLLRRSAAAVAAATTVTTARLGTRRGRNRQSGDTRCKKKPARHQKNSFRTGSTAVNSRRSSSRRCERTFYRSKVNLTFLVCSDS